MKKLHLETLALHVGQETPDPASDSRAVPIYQTTSYVFRNSQHAADRFGLRDPGNIYGRLTNSTQGVLEERVATTDWRHDCTAFWSLPIHAAPNPAVLAAIRERRPVDYQNIKTLADFVLIQVGWMISGLTYATTRRLTAERNHLEFRRRFLHELTDDPAVDELCDMARREGAKAGR